MNKNDQSWFWEPNWFKGELQASVEAAAGLGRVYDNDVDFLESLTA